MVTKAIRIPIACAFSQSRLKIQSTINLTLLLFLVINELTRTLIIMYPYFRFIEVWWSTFQKKKKSIMSGESDLKTCCVFVVQVSNVAYRYFVHIGYVCVRICSSSFYACLHTHFISIFIHKNTCIFNKSSANM